MAHLFFSIVVVSLNPGEKLVPTLKSVLDQDYGNFEIIIKDGGSTDGSVEKLEELPEDHPCIFRSNHVSNYVQLAGTLPKDKERLLGEIAWSASELGKIKDWDVYNNTRY